MTGSWSHSDHGSTWDENWIAPRGDAAFAVSRMVKDGVTKLAEMSVIEDSPEGPVLRIRHFSRSLEPWKSEADGPVTLPFREAGEKRIVFEDPKRDFPRRLTYERKGDLLTATLEGEHGGQPAGTTFTFKLQAPR